MVKKTWLFLRLLVFVLTIRYAVALCWCIPEYAWTVHPSDLLRPSYYQQSQSKEVDKTDEVRTAVTKLYSNYDGLQGLNYSEELDRDTWMDSIDNSIWKLISQGTAYEGLVLTRMKKHFSSPETSKVSEGVFANEAAKNDFFSAYKAYLDVVANIKEELDTLYLDSRDQLESIDSRLDACNKSLRENRKRHTLAVKDLVRNIPAPLIGTSQSSTPKVRRNSVPSTVIVSRILGTEGSNPCLRLWEERYGDKVFAQNLSVIVKWFIRVWLLSCILRLGERLFLGTYLVATLQGFVLGYLWSIYYDAPRHAILWLLEIISPRKTTPSLGIL